MAISKQSSESKKVRFATECPPDALWRALFWVDIAPNR
jgi:hypothetical protein